jgi:isopenicillin N synthase-like dioxygenase
VHKPFDEGHRHTVQQVNAAVAEANVGLASAVLPPAQIPQVDISCFVHPERATPADRDAVVEHVLAISQRVGFMNIVGHGVPQSVIDGALAALTVFFQAPIEDKQRCIAKSGHGTQRGYASYKSENTNAVLGRAGPADLRESYSFGPPVQMGGSAYGANTYPDFIDEFGHHVDNYYVEMRRVEIVLLEVFSLALAKLSGRNLDSQHLLAQIGPNMGLLKAAWSPPCRPASDDVRCAAHTDLGPLTILLTTSPGLEVCLKSEDGKGYQWQSVPVVPGAFTVNIGDMLARWSNDCFASSLHRVNANVNCDAPRLSIPYFSTQILPLRPNSNPKVECICRDGEKPKYEPLTIEDYLRHVFSRLQTNERTGGA